MILKTEQICATVMDFEKKNKDLSCILSNDIDPGWGLIPQNSSDRNDGRQFREAVFNLFRNGMWSLSEADWLAVRAISYAECLVTSAAQGVFQLLCLSSE